MKSCTYIQSAIYLAPNEIRACCQRFFDGKEIKGDVLLLKPHGDVLYPEIEAAKENLIKSINNGTDDRCNGCPHLKDFEWKSISQEYIKNISIEDHSLCNMKCEYCSDTYYGGLKPSYNISKIIESADGNFHKNLHIAWGGGEPTIRNDFEQVFDYISSTTNPATQRVFTNALKYSKVLQKYIDERKCFITTSIDAGTEDTFLEVRGSKGLERVFKNLERYSALNPDLITIKYIFTGKNFSSNELEKFCELVQQFNLTNCDFLISTDFKTSKPDKEIVSGLIELYFLLIEIGANCVTFDDHVSSRVRDIQQSFPKKIEDYLQSANVNKLEVMIWGTGTFADFLINSSSNIKNKVITVAGVIDEDELMIGKKFHSYEIFNPDILNNTESYLVIGSSNFYGEIYRKVISMGFDKSKILPSFLL